MHKERERGHDREQSKPAHPHTRQKTVRTVEHYPMTYYYEEVRREFGALQLDLGGAPVPVPSGARDPASEYGAQGQGQGTAPLRPRRKEREEQGAERERREGPRPSRR